MARAHLRPGKQVYGLSDLAEPDGELLLGLRYSRLTQIRITWHSLATGQSRPGQLKLETPHCEATHHGWRGDATSAQDVRHQPEGT